MRRLGALVGALALVAGISLTTAGRAADGAIPPQGADCAAGDGHLAYTFTGSFGTDLEGSYVLLPFEVPEGTTRVRARLTHPQIPFPNPVTKHTLDLGLYDARPGAGAGLHAADEFRGWGGSSRLDVCVSPSEATPGFNPGPIPAGEWAAEIGIAAVAGAAEGDPSETVEWTLEIFLSDDPAHETPAWEPAVYDETPADDGPGWYMGDLHVHAEHSGSPATMGAAFDFAFADPPEGAGLDFITLSDYVGTRHWDEIGHFQGDYPGKLIIRSAEVITYRGHVNNHASGVWADHRAGDVYEAPPCTGAGFPITASSGCSIGEDDLVLVRSAGDYTARDIFATIKAAGQGWTQVNHPTTFPATVPPFGNFCRGCSWEYSDEETDWSLVDAFEVQTGPAATPDRIQGQPVGLDGVIGPNPFAVLAIEWWDRLHRQGFGITGVGVSDSHRAHGQDFLFSPIGEATTVVYAPELSEQGIAEGVRAGHVYVKFVSPQGPDLRFEARHDPSSDDPDGIMGDEVVVDDVAGVLHFTARVMGEGTGPGPLTLHVFRDGVPVLSMPVVGDDFTHEFVATVPGDYRLQVQRGTTIEALTNPITLVVAGNPLSHTHASDAPSGPPDHAKRPDHAGQSGPPPHARSER